MHIIYVCACSARQFYEDQRVIFSDDEDVQPMLLALQFIVSRDEIETSKPVREFRYGVMHLYLARVAFFIIKGTVFGFAVAIIQIKKSSLNF